MDTSERKKRRQYPIERANPLSLITFGYTLGLFRKGFKKDLEEDDIYEVMKSCQSKQLGDLTEERWGKSKSVVSLLLYRFGGAYLFLSAVSLAWAEINSILSPLGQSKLISYFTPNSKITKNQAYEYAGVVVFLKFGAFFIMNNTRVYQTIVGLKMHASLKSLLYRKALKLTPTSSPTGLGNLITLITKDINYIEQNIWLLKDFTVFFIEFITIAYLMYNKMGVPAFIGLGILFVSLPLQGYLSAKLKDIRLRVQVNSDERLQKTQEALSCIKIIKMYTWESFFHNRITVARKKEIKNMVYVYLIQTFNNVLGTLISKLTFCILIIIYLWMGYKTDTEMIFYVNQLFTQLNLQFGMSLPSNFSKSAQLYASLLRLNEVLRADELKNTIDEELVEKPTVLLKDVSFRFGEKEILKGITVNINNPGLTVVTGSVGSGKSSLLKVMLQDYQPISEGHSEVHGSISYASQDPWLFPATIQQNILFGEEFDQERYDEVVRVCALRYDFSLFDDGDETIVSDKGMNLSKGQQARINLARAVYRNSNIYLFDDSLTALDGHVQDYIFNRCILNFLKDKICILVTQNPRHIEEADQVIVLTDGKPVYSGNSQHVDKNILNSFATQVSDENDAKEQAEHIGDEKKFSLVQTEQQHAKKNVYKETKRVGKVAINTYQKYFQSGGGIIVFCMIILLYVGAQFIDSTADKMLTQWVDDQQKVIDLENNGTRNGTEYDEAVADKNKTFTIYCTLTGLKSITALIKMYCLLKFCQRASVRLHKAMTRGLMGAKMSFYDNHFIGNILNRFSYDLNNIDEFIPFLFPALGSTLFSAGGALVLITSVNWFFLIPAIVFLIILIIMRYLYIPTGRSLKRLEAATRSPLVGHINSSLEGLTTIRAYKAEQILKDEFDKHQDLYTSAFMTVRIAMTAIGFFMDFFNSFFTIIVIARFLFFDISTTAGNVGLALNQVFQLTMGIDFAVRLWSDLETSMTSVERAGEYTTLEQEKKDGDIIENWPSKGGIRFENVDLCYEGSRTSVLKKINLDIKPQEKVGIVGRTGAGKSSIITTLYRLYDFDGKIEIDGVDTKTVSMEYLRKNIAIIPQDPVLFTGTFRENIDPFDRYTDDHIWEVIEKVGIKEMVPSLELYIENSGAKYSSGQKQLVCLARAAIAKCRILVLDEATANMDVETEKMLNTVVEEIFADCTILAIAHRIHSILHYDKVLVLDRGNVAEFDNPKVLLNKTDSMFHRICEEAKMA